MGSLGIGEQEGITDLRYDNVLSGSKGRMYEQMEGDQLPNSLAGITSMTKSNFNKTIVLTQTGGKKKKEGEIEVRQAGKTFLKPSEQLS